MTANATISKLVLFDACMPKMDDCWRGVSCNDVESLCVHKLGLEAEVIYTSPYIDFLRFSDFQVTLHFLHRIISLKNNQKLSDECLFFIATKDQGFLKAVENEWSKRGQNMTFLFDDHGVTATFSFKKRKYHIRVEVIILRSNSDKARDILGKAINALGAS